jgi:hypothetical protein
MTPEPYGALDDLSRDIGEAGRSLDDPAALRSAAERITTAARRLESQVTGGDARVEDKTRIAALRDGLDALAARLGHRESVLAGFGAYLRAGAERD